jgi:hypothetical protein
MEMVLQREMKQEPFNHLTHDILMEENPLSEACHPKFSVVCVFGMVVTRRTGPAGPGQAFIKKRTDGAMEVGTSSAASSSEATNSKGRKAEMKVTGPPSPSGAMLLTSLLLCSSAEIYDSSPLPRRV